MPESDRRLISAPIRLAEIPDLEALRRRMGTAQAKIGQAPDATKGGNATKRIRLRLEIPGYQPGDAADLEGTLAGPVARVVPTFILAWHPLRSCGTSAGTDRAIQVTAAGRALAGGVDRRGAERRHQPGTGRLFTASTRTGPGGQRSLHLRRRSGPHWDGSGRQARYGQVVWDIVLDYVDRLPIEQLKAEVPEVTGITSKDPESRPIVGSSEAP